MENAHEEHRSHSDGGDMPTMGRCCRADFDAPSHDIEREVPALYAGDLFRAKYVSSVGFAAIDQAADTPKGWGRDGQGYLNRLGTVGGQPQIGSFCASGAGAAFHEDPRFLPSGKHGMWRRTGHGVMHSVVARTDRGTEQLTFANFGAALGPAFFSAAWLPPSESTVGNSFKRSALFFGMDAGINMGIEFGPVDRRFFNGKDPSPIPPAQERVRRAAALRLGDKMRQKAMVLNFLFARLC